MMKSFFKKYNYIRYLIYFFIIYLIGFFILEQRDAIYYIETETRIDQYIPFNEYFVIPYLLWFVFIALGFAYFIFVDTAKFKKTCFYLFVGMYVCLFIYLIFPNEQNLRVVLSNDNIFQRLVSFIYSIDTPTNVCPSIHVYNSIMMTLSLLKSEKIRKRKGLSIGIVILASLICLSTVMIKQHAVLDVVAAIFLCALVYYLEIKLSGIKYENKRSVYRRL